MYTTKAAVKIKHEKKTGLNGIQIHDHCDTNWEMVTFAIL